MEVIIYIPGLAYDFFEQSVRSYAKRLMKAIDENEEDESKTYSLDVNQYEYGEGSVTHVATIYEITPEGKSERVRIYEYRYSEFLTAKLESGSIIKKSFLLFFALLERFPRFIISIFNLRSSIPLKYKLQSIYFTLSYIFVTLLALLMLPAILTSFASLLNDNFLAAFPSLSKLIETLTEWAQFLVGTFALILLTAPKVKTFVSVVGTEYLALNYYFKYGESRLKIIGKLSRLLEFVSEKEDNKKISIHGYSMGSIIGLDSLFPYESAPNYRFRDKIKTLVTIGCPYDFVRTYWPHYFKERLSSVLELKNWYNIYSSLDMLSSNFRDDSQRKDPDQDVFMKGVKPQNVIFDIVNPSGLSVLDYLTMLSLRAHTMYWDEDLDAKNCLSALELKKKSN